MLYLFVGVRPFGGTLSSSPNWTQFGDQIQKDLKLWFGIGGTLMLFRLFLVYVFREQIAAETTGADIFAALLNGARFDGRVAAFLVFPSLVLSFISLSRDLGSLADRLRIIIASTSAGCTVLLGRIDIGYFREFHNQFDDFMIGALSDDFGAILTTISKEHYPAWEVMITIPVMVSGGLLAGRWTRSPFSHCGPAPVFARTPLRRYASVLAIVVFFVVAVRGSVGTRPVQRKDAAISGDRFLNKVIFDPYTALRYSWATYRTLFASSGLTTFIPDGDIVAAAQRIASSNEPLDDISGAMRRVAAGPKGRPPRHVFILVMESLDGWPFLERYASLGLTDNLKELAANGIWFRNFLAASGSTTRSFTTLVTGLADAGLWTNYQPTARDPYPSSLPLIFNRLGYRTRFFYGGFASRHRIGEFTRDQGFDEVHCGGDMGGWTKGNEWGVDDEDLFRFVMNTINDDQPSLNMILTTSYHPPYDIDVYGMGYSLRELPVEFEGNATPLELGHLWYADKVAGEFVNRVVDLYPQSLVAITGDHWSRRSLSHQPTAFEQAAVPLILYGPDVLAGVDVSGIERVGSHLDLGPTLVEFAAPAGTEYHALGRDILAPRNKPVAFSRLWIMGPDYILSTLPGESFEALPETDPPLDPPDPSELLHVYEDLHGVSWWLIKNGPQLPAEVAPRTASSLPMGTAETTIPEVDR